MITEEIKEIPFRRDLGDRLILRQATPNDSEALAAFNADVLREQGAEKPDEFVAAWTRDLMSGGHPSFRPGDFTVVEDARTGAIVSSLCLISQTLTYGGIAVKAGQPELVGTHPDYRRRGLIRAQFDVIHRWSAERGQRVQFILGIPWYYRQFCYEMALEAHGARKGYRPHVPALKDGQEEPYRIRPATEEDIPFISEVYERGMKRYEVACLRSEAEWRHELRKDVKHMERRELRLIETLQGEPVGFFAHPPRLWHTTLFATAYELKPGVSWGAVTPGVIRYLEATGRTYAVRDEPAWEAFAFGLGSEHPVYLAFPDMLPEVQKPYAYYVRVADLPGFLSHISKALEDRIARSTMSQHTGELRLNFYRGGLRLQIEDGQLAAAEAWEPSSCLDGDAAFPGLTFLQLLFGFRSLEELRHAFPDGWTRGDETEALLKTLFPKQPSSVWHIS